MNQQQQQKQPQHQHPQQAQQLDQSSNFGANAAMQPFMATQQQPFHDAVHGQQPMGHGPYPGRMNPQAELQHMQQQLQHLYTLPPNPQTQQQISELHERVTVLQRQGWSGSIGMPPQQQQQFGMGGPSPYMPQVSLLLSFVYIDTKTFLPVAASRSGLSYGTWWADGPSRRPHGWQHDGTSHASGHGRPR